MTLRPGLRRLLELGVKIHCGAGSQNPCETGRRKKNVDEERKAKGYPGEPSNMTKRPRAKELGVKTNHQKGAAK